MRGLDNEFQEDILSIQVLKLWVLQSGFTQAENQIVCKMRQNNDSGRHLQ